ncbi:hypothetical protein OHV05_00190 [Kitasatospora sp. NBC_00070]|uniref:hypothetical protein n=1 Tax=Kitasatospora sp. NBC_00070 TaxID=2975962 RepID=UPI003250D089
MLVLDSYGRDWAYVVWLADDVNVCVAALTRDRGRTIMFGPIDELANQTSLIGMPQFDPAIFAVFPGIDSEIVLTGDTPHTFHPARSRTVALGPGRVVTFAVSRFAVPFQGSRLGGQLCPARDGVCQPMRS